MANNTSKNSRETQGPKQMFHADSWKSAGTIGYQHINNTTGDRKKVYFFTVFQMHKYIFKQCQLSIG